MCTAAQQRCVSLTGGILLSYQTTHKLYVYRELVMTSPGLSLFRKMTRQARLIDDYNFREFALRKLRNQFRRNAGIAGDELKNVLEVANVDFEVIKRYVKLIFLFIL